MKDNESDVRPEEQPAGLHTTVLDLFPERDQVTGADPMPPDTCASCGGTEATQWLKLITDWEDIVCRESGISRPDGVSLVPLCDRCRVWAEMLEIAEMAVHELPASEKRRIRQERNRFLETLDPNLIRGIRMSAELSSFSD